MGRRRLIELRQDTSAAWAAENPVLELGEPGWDATVGILKIGDGVTAWDLLPAAGANIGALPGSSLGRGTNAVQLNLINAGQLYDVPGCTITFDPNPTRDTWIVWKIPFIGGPAASNCIGYVTDELNAEKDRDGFRPSTANYYGHIAGDEVIPAGTPGPITRKLRASSSLANGFTNLANGGLASIDAFVR